MNPYANDRPSCLAMKISFGILLGIGSFSVSGKEHIDLFATCLLFENERLEQLGLDSELVKTALSTPNSPLIPDARTFEHAYASSKAPKGCEFYSEDARAAVARYYISQNVAWLSKETGASIVPSKLVAPPDDCDDALVAIAENRAGMRRELEGLFGRYEEWIEAHPILSDQGLKRLRAEEAKWRAYRLGRARETLAGRKGLVAYDEALKSMLTLLQTAPESTSDIQLWQLITHLSLRAKRSPPFGLVSSADPTPLEFASFAGRLNAWHYIMSGRPPLGYSSKVDDTLAFDVSSALLGTIPAPDSCSLIDEADAKAALDAAVKKGAEDSTFALNHILTRLSKNNSHRHVGGHTTFKQLASPHAYPATSDTCIGTDISVQYVTDIFEHDDTLVTSQISVESPRLEEYADGKLVGPTWSKAFLDASADPDSASDELRRAVDEESANVLLGRYEKYPSAVSVRQVNACKTERVGPMGLEIDVPVREVLQQKTIFGSWRD